MLQYRKGVLLNKPKQEITNNSNDYPVNVISFIQPDTKKEFYTPKSDVIFRSLFGRGGSEKIVKSLLESICGYKIGNISLNANPELPRNYVKDKQMISDIKAIDEQNNTVYFIEMQNQARSGLEQRFSAYAYKEFNDNLKRKVKYKNVSKVVLIAFVAENIPRFKNIKEYHTVWNSREKVFSDFVLNENVTIHLIELKKYIVQRKNGGAINPWLEFIIAPLSEEVKKIMRTAEEFRLAVDLLNLLNSDDEVRDFAFKEKLAELDFNSAIDESETRGEKRGEKQGERNGIRISVKKMLKSGMKLEKIAEILEMKKEDLQSILDDESLN